MKEAINEVACLISEHFHNQNKRDISVVVNTRDMLEIVKLTDIARYDEANIEYDGEYFFVSSCVVGDTTLFFVESVHNESGVLKHDDTDVLIIPSYLPQEIVDHLIETDGFETLINLNEDSSYEELIKQYE